MANISLWVLGSAVAISKLGKTSFIESGPLEYWCMSCSWLSLGGCAAMRPRGLGADLDRRRGPWCVGSDVFKKRRRSRALRRVAIVGDSSVRSLDALAGDDSALTVAGVDIAESVAVSFDTGATVIPQKSFAVGVVVAE